MTRNALTFPLRHPPSHHHYAIADLVLVSSFCWFISQIQAELGNAMLLPSSLVGTLLLCDWDGLLLAWPEAASSNETAVPVRRVILTNVAGQPCCATTPTPTTTPTHNWLEKAD